MATCRKKVAIGFDMHGGSQTEATSQEGGVGRKTSTNEADVVVNKDVGDLSPCQLADVPNRPDYMRAIFATACEFHI